MDRRVYDRLSVQEQIRLAVLWESEDMAVIRKASIIFQELHAQDTLAGSPNHEHTVSNRGQVIGGRFLADLAKYAYHAKKTAKEA